MMRAAKTKRNPRAGAPRRASYCSGGPTPTAVLDPSTLLDAARLRADFPLLQRTVHDGRPLVYLDVRGLASLLVRVFDGLPAAEAAAADLWFAREIGLAEHLSPNRANGLDAMVRTIRQAAGAA